MGKLQFNTLLEKEARELLRSRKLLIGLVVFIFFSLMSPLSAKYMPEVLKSFVSQQGIVFELPTPTAADSLVQFLKNLSQIGLFVMIFLVMGIVSAEKDQGTAAFLMVKPVPRSSFILAKYLILWIFIALLMTASFLVCAAYTYLLFGEVPLGPLAVLSFMLFVYMGSILSITILMSTLCAGQAAAGIFSMVIWLLLSLLSRIRGIGIYLNGALMSEAQAVIHAMTPDIRPFIGSLALSALCAFLAVLFFRRWEA